MDRDPTFERASMRNKLRATGPRYAVGLSQPNSSWRTKKYRPPSSACPRRKERRPPDPTRPTLRRGSLRWLSVLKGDATTAYLISHSTEAPRNPHPLRCPRASRLRRRVSSLWSGIRVPGEWLLCRQARWLRSQVATAQA